MSDLTKRDEFAARALSGLLANPKLFDVMVAGLAEQSYAQMAVFYADALMQELEKEPKPVNQQLKRQSRYFGSEQEEIDREQEDLTNSQM